MRTLGRAPLVVSLVVALVAACDGSGEPSAAPTGTLTAFPVTPAVSPVEPAPSGSVSPGPTASPPASGPRDPTDADRARFVADHRPSGTSNHRNLAVDLDGDDQREIVFAYVVDAENRSQVDIADWTGTEYRVTEQAPGGPADELADLEIRDLNADGTIEVAVFQRSGASGSSATVWASSGNGTIVPLNARGDCFDGRNTYGDTGVAIEDRDGDGAAEIYATCQDEDLPAPLWPEVVYVWEDGVYRCDHRERPDGPDTPCQGSGNDAG
ncbi:MAG: hypothetical protein KY437_07955 [Actinobacteria bacterium]|nr:hypothetical protein [Actinomycetota bacterium]